MKLPSWLNWHSIGTVVVTVGAWAASTLIPATAAIALGPISIPVAGLVASAIAIAAAQGIIPHPAIQKALESVTPKKP
jgi:hypothetical protein